jgi:HEAT repeat protein
MNRDERKGGKKDPVEERRSRLNAVKSGPITPQSLEILRKGLSDRVQVVVARAAEIAAELSLRALGPDLARAFERLLVDPLKRDKGCLGKTALMEALVKLEYDDARVFLEGIAHVQREPVWGGTEDTAAWMRGLAASGLVQARHPEELDRVVDLLADPEKHARIGAARALALLGRDEGAAVLRFMLLQGDEDSEVMAEAFSAYLRLTAPDSGCAFVSRFLAHEDAAVVEAAAIALGESRHPRAVELLKDAFERILDPSLRRVLLVALALTRSDPANDFLLSLIAEGAPRTARAARTALEPFLYNEELAKQVRNAVASRKDDAFTE